MDKFMKNKRSLEVATSCSSGYKFRKKSSISDVSKFDDVILSVFELFLHLLIYANQLMKSWILLSFAILNLGIVERKKQKSYKKIKFGHV